jgi:uncharacterized membrane protein YcaP (DUF421 family)
MRKEKVALAFWEEEGKISFFLYPKYEPLTSSSCQIEVEPYDYPRTIIKEGKIMIKELQQTHTDVEWVIFRLDNEFQTEVKNVLLATIDRKNNQKIFLYK